MTVKEAIENLKAILEEATETEDAVSYVTSVDAESLNLAISALEKQIPQKAQKDLQPTCNNLATDTISRQAAIDALKGLPTWWADEGGYYGGAQPPMVALLEPEDAVSAIENLPSVQPERKKGEWIDDTFCSECGWTHEVESGFIGSVKQFSFCPNCGTDMRGK